MVKINIYVLYFMYNTQGKYSYKFSLNPIILPYFSV